ncbi:NUDIX domain-containing protein [Elusimicrobiota bacterium]
MKSLIEKKINSTCVLKGAVNFINDVVELPNGKTATRMYIDHPGAVAIVPFLSKKKVILLKQYRYPVGKTILEFPAGKLDRGESPLACARRELLEETGYYPKKIKKFTSYWPTAAFCTETLHIYKAWDLEARTPGTQDPDEFLEMMEVNFDQVIEWIRIGKILDSKTVVAALALKCFKLV